MTDTARRLRGLVYSAEELRAEHPEWSAAFTEDYLNILDNLITLADNIDTKGDFLKSTSRVTSDYNVSDSDQEIFCDTDFSAISIQLPAGVDGRKLRIHNTGTSGNALTIIPSGTDLLFGANEPEVLYDTEVVVITFETIEGWD